MAGKQGTESYCIPCCRVPALRVVIIVQARMDSTRLPGKVLLPAAGKPMLTHLVDRLRSARLADEIVVATSREKQDDVIAEFCAGYGVATYRGSEQDVLSRYAEAAAEYEADVVVRITGDCPLIDPALVDEVISRYLESPGSRVYVSNNPQYRRIYPRGMDTEVFSRKLLEWANRKAVLPYDREHVTPIMVRNEGSDIAMRSVDHRQNFSAYRFTLDYAKDYDQLSKLLECGLTDYSWRNLLRVAEKLGLDWRDNAEEPEGPQTEKQEPGPKPADILSRFGLGTAQFGMYYGMFNREGVPSIGAVSRILRSAREFGLSVVDTAREYGEAELALGGCLDELKQFRVITKTPNFSREKITSADAEALRNAFDLSLENLRMPSVDGLLVHNASDLLAPGGEWLFEALAGLKGAGRVRHIGISAYTGEIAERVVEKFPIDVVQLPCNVFDRRLLQAGTLSRLGQRGIEVHARSAFLQGLLLADPGNLATHFDKVRTKLRGFQAAAGRAGATAGQAALHYLLQVPEITRIIVGVESVGQLNELFEGWPDSIDMDFSEFGVEHVEILNPVMWVQ